MRILLCMMVINPGTTIQNYICYMIQVQLNVAVYKVCASEGKTALYCFILLNYFIHFFHFVKVLFVYQKTCPC